MSSTYPPRTARHLFAFAVAIAAFYSFTAGSAFAFGFDDVAQRARQLAAKTYEKPPDLAKELQALTYDQHRDIRFKPQRSRWRGAATRRRLSPGWGGWRRGSTTSSSRGWPAWSSPSR